MHNPGNVGSKIYGVLVTLAAGFGVGVASWHVRLQNMPADDIPSCGPGFEYIVDNFPLSDALGMIFQGSGECAEVVWRLLGLSMPTWVIIGTGWPRHRRNLEQLPESLRPRPYSSISSMMRRYMPVSVMTSSTLTCSSIL